MPQSSPTLSGSLAVPGSTCAVVVERSWSPITVERDFAGGARGDRNGHAVARAVFRLVEGDLEQVGRIGARFGVPAGIEADGGLRPLRSAVVTSSR